MENFLIGMGVITQSRQKSSSPACSPGV